MPRIPVHSVADAPGAVQDTLAANAAQVDRVANIHGQMAHAPVVLATYAAIQQPSGVLLRWFIAPPGTHTSVTQVAAQWARKDVADVGITTVGGIQPLAAVEELV